MRRKIRDGLQSEFDSHSDLPDARVEDTQFPRFLESSFTFYGRGDLEILRRGVLKFEHREYSSREIRKARPSCYRGKVMYTTRTARIYPDFSGLASIELEVSQSTFRYHGEFAPSWMWDRV